jgi:hypothetical protein
MPLACMPILLSGVRGQLDLPNQLLGVIPENSEKVGNLAIEVVIRFNGSGFPVDENGGGTAERFNIPLLIREEGEEPIEMAILSTEVTESDEFPGH